MWICALKCCSVGLCVASDVKIRSPNIRLILMIHTILMPLNCTCAVNIMKCVTYVRAWKLYTLLHGRYIVTYYCTDQCASKNLSAEGMY